MESREGSRRGLALRRHLRNARFGLERIAPGDHEHRRTELSANLVHRASCFGIGEFARVRAGLRFGSTVRTDQTAGPRLFPNHDERRVIKIDPRRPLRFRDGFVLQCCGQFPERSLFIGPVSRPVRAQPSRPHRSRVWPTRPLNFACWRSGILHCLEAQPPNDDGLAPVSGTAAVA